MVHTPNVHVSVQLCRCSSVCMCGWVLSRHMCHQGGVCEHVSVCALSGPRATPTCVCMAGACCLGPMPGHRGYIHLMALDSCGTWLSMGGVRVYSLCVI